MTTRTDDIGKSGSIHVHYGFNAAEAIDSLKLWLSTIRGYWHLACEYSITTADRSSGIVFQQGYQSAELARNLEMIMRHQDAFQPAISNGRPGLLQVRIPTEQQQTEAALAAITAARLLIYSSATAA